MLVFGGGCSRPNDATAAESPCLDGGLYDPEEDTWQTVEMPEWYQGTIRPFVGVVHGKVLVWGGYQRGLDAAGLPTMLSFNHGAILALGELEWSSMSMEQAPSAMAKLVSTADRILAFDGATVSSFDGDRWSSLTSSPVPGACCDEFMALRGGALGFVYALPTEEPQFREIWRYTAEGERWEAVPLPAIEPSPRSGGAMVTTNNSLVLWGGSPGPEEWGCEGHYKGCNHGAVVDFRTGEWQLLNREGAPSPRTRPVSVWIDEGVFIWGGISPDFLQTNSSDGAILRLD